MKFLFGVAVWLHSPMHSSEVMDWCAVKFFAFKRKEKNHKQILNSNDMHGEVFRDD